MLFESFRRCLDTSLDVMSGQEGAFQQIAEEVVRTQREVVVTAIGKSGYIAQKFAASLRSIGIPSYFLHAAEAGHGDIGNVVASQIVFAISKSGTTAEISALVPALKARKSILVAITNRPNSPLAETSDFSIYTGVQEEGSLVADVPLVSTQAALFACDYLISLIAEKRQLTREDFLYNHPAGQIGANLRYRVADYIDMSKRADIRVSPDDRAMDALLVTTRGRIGAVAVVDDGGRICGYLSDGDFRRLVGRGVDLGASKVRDVMNPSPIVVQDEMKLGEVLALFENATPPIGSAPVVDGSQMFIGVISIHDLLISR